MDGLMSGSWLGSGSGLGLGSGSGLGFGLRPEELLITPHPHGIPTPGSPPHLGLQLLQGLVQPWQLERRLLVRGRGR